MSEQFNTVQEHVAFWRRRRYGDNQSVPAEDILRRHPFTPPGPNPARSDGRRFNDYGDRLHGLELEGRRERNVAREIEARKQQRTMSVSEAQLAIAREEKKQYLIMQADPNNRGRDFSDRLARVDADIRQYEGEVAAERGELDLATQRELHNSWRLSRALMESDETDELLSDESLRERFEVAKHRLLNDSDLDTAAVEYREFATELQKLRNDKLQAEAITANKGAVDAIHAASAANNALDRGRAIEGALQ